MNNLADTGIDIDIETAYCLINSCTAFIYLSISTACNSTQIININCHVLHLHQHRLIREWLVDECAMCSMRVMLPWKRPTFSRKSPIFSKELYILSKEPYLLSKEPSIRIHCWWMRDRATAYTSTSIDIWMTHSMTYSCVSAYLSMIHDSFNDLFMYLSMSHDSFRCQLMLMYVKLVDCYTYINIHWRILSIHATSYTHINIHLHMCIFMHTFLCIRAYASLYMRMYNWQKRLLLLTSRNKSSSKDSLIHCWCCCSLSGPNSLRIQSSERFITVSRSFRCAYGRWLNSFLYDFQSYQSSSTSWGEKSITIASILIVSTGLGRTYPR